MRSVQCKTNKVLCTMYLTMCNVHVQSAGAMCNMQCAIACATCKGQCATSMLLYLQCALFKMQHAMCSIYWAPYNVVDMRREKCDINDKSSWNLYRHKGLILTWAGHAQHFVYTVGTWRLARQGNFKFGAHCLLAQKMPKHFFYISGSLEEFLPITGAIWGWGQFSSVAFFKWTVHRDFRPLVFFIIRTGLSHWPMG